MKFADHFGVFACHQPEMIPAQGGQQFDRTAIAGQIVSHVGRHARQYAHSEQDPLADRWQPRKRLVREIIEQQGMLGGDLRPV
jgi:hypothetical protein